LLPESEDEVDGDLFVPMQSVRAGLVLLRR